MTSSVVAFDSAGYFLVGLVSSSDDSSSESDELAALF